jgi:importin subunit alpha-1
MQPAPASGPLNAHNDQQVGGMAALQAPPASAADVAAQIEEIVAGIKSGDTAQVLSSTKRCRMLLSKEQSPPITEVMDAGLTQVFVQMLECDDLPDLQFEAAWALTNIASGTSEQTLAVAHAGAVPQFIRLLSHSRQDLQEQSVWALGNIAGDSPELRDYTLSEGVLAPLLYFLNEPSSKLTMLRNGTWTLSNMCRGKNPAPNFESIRDAVPVLAQLLHHRDEEVMTDAAWALSYLTDGDNDKIQAVVEAGVAGRLVDLLRHHKPAVVTPALRAVGNMVTGTDSQTQAVLDAGALQAFITLLNSPKENLRKECCWTISNITAGTKDQIQSVCDANLIPPLIHIISTAEFRTRKEATWALSNLTSGGSPRQVQYLVSQGVIKPLSDLLEMQDAKMLGVVLDAFSNVLKHGDSGSGENAYTDFVDECGGMEKIEQLQNHENESIYDKALKIMEKYFAEDEDDEVELTSNSTSGFQFGAGAPVATGFAF